MKRFIRNILLLAAVAVSGTACEEYLDKSPDMGLDESVIYKNYESIRGYIDRCYPLLTMWNNRGKNGANSDLNPMSITDELAHSINQNNFAANQFNLGNWYFATRGTQWEVGVDNAGTDEGRPTINASYKALRIANRVIGGIDKVQNCTDAQKKEILGQAYFYRAWFYYQLVIRYGGMPKIDRVFAGDGDEKLARMTARESFDWLISDLDQAISMLPDLWDDKNFSRPDKAAAMGVKAQALLYAASPLFQNGLKETKKMPYDKDLCLEAAKAAQDVISYISTTETGRKFVVPTGVSTNPGVEPIDGMDQSVIDVHNVANSYHRIFVTPTTTFYNPEYLWWDRRNIPDMGPTVRVYWLPYIFDKESNTGSDAQSFSSPTANIVSLYERKGADGKYYPIFDPDSGYQFKAEASSVPDKDKWKYDAGVWANMQNRDPRFYHNILLPGQRWGKLLGHEYYIDTWKGSATLEGIRTQNFSSVREFSGFLCGKYLWPEASMHYDGANDDNKRLLQYRYRSFYIRVTEMYLDYAEALFEATGDATTIPAGFTMSAVDALNIVRARVGVTPVVDKYTHADKFRDTYRRERAVEMMFENHRWEDIRRWMIFDEIWPTINELYNVVWTCEQDDIQSTNSRENYTVIRDTYHDGADLTFTYELKLNNVEVRVYNQNGTMKYYLYPFCGAELGSLPKYTQNPGW